MSTLSVTSGTFAELEDRNEMPHRPEMYQLKVMLEQTYPHHGYAFEPQRHPSLLHGDFWDRAYDRTHDQTPPPDVFLPVTLELRSWRWIRKGPSRLFYRLGMFNPAKAHRVERVLRRQATLFDFLSRAAFASNRWMPEGDARAPIPERAMEHSQRKSSR
jgi:hypothetical protein